LALRSVAFRASIRGLRRLAAEFPAVIKEVRGLGLMLGVEEFLWRGGC
jgi:4-aminobutyrate aminotransferase-like enzyme